MSTQLALSFPAPKPEPHITPKGYLKYGITDSPDEVPHGYYRQGFGSWVELRPYQLWLFRRLMKAIKTAKQPLDIHQMHIAAHGTNEMVLYDDPRYVCTYHIVRHLDVLEDSGLIRVERVYFGDSEPGQPDYHGFKHVWSWNK